MPPKKKRKAKTPKSKPTQTQKQKQSIVINIGGSKSTKSKPRKSSGSGGLPPPSHMHNLAPTFVTAPPVDFTPLLSMIQQQTRPIVQQAPMPVQNPTTPLSSANVETNNQAVQQRSGQAAIRRAGRTAANFQRRSSESSRFESSDSDAELARQVQARDDRQDERVFNEKIQARREAQHAQRVAVAEAVEPIAVAQPVEQLEEQLLKKGFSAGKQVAEEEVEKKIQTAEQRGRQAAEEEAQESKRLQERLELKKQEESASAFKEFYTTFSQRAEKLNPMQEDELERFRTDFQKQGLEKFGTAPMKGELSRKAQEIIRKSRTPKKSTQEVLEERKQELATVKKREEEVKKKLPITKLTPKTAKTQADLDILNKQRRERGIIGGKLIFKKGKVVMGDSSDSDV